MVEISVVVPVFKGEASLPELHDRLTGNLKAIPGGYEILLVEDCGGDQSWKLIQDLAARDPHVRGLRFSRNFGQHSAITAGLEHARGAWAVVMDCDLQDQPEEIPKLYAKAQEGFDVVVARRGRRQDGFWKRLSSLLFYRVFSYLAGIRVDSEVGNFRIISRKVVDTFARMQEKTRFFGGLVDWMGFPTAAVNVQHAARSTGKSTYTFRKLFNLALEIIIAYSDKPLWMTIRFGFLVSLFALGGGVYVVWRAIVYGTPIMGWASLFVSLYFLGGVIISILGVIGVYLGKTFDETKKRPHYIIRDSVN